VGDGRSVSAIPRNIAFAEDVGVQYALFQLWKLLEVISLTAHFFAPGCAAGQRFPIANRCFAVRTKIRLCEIAGEACTISPKEFFGRT
jgi:hypothetical protein